MDNSTSLIAQQIPIGLVLVFVQNWLKQQKWFPLIGYDTTKANHIFSILTTGLATLGIHFSYSSADHSLLISGLAWQAIASASWHWLQQYAITKGLYTGLAQQLNPPTAQQPTAVVDTSELPASKTDATTQTTNNPYKVT